MRTLQLTEAQSRLPELVEALASGGEEVVIVSQGQAVARLVGPPATSLRDLRPSSVGEVLRPLTPDDDLLEEMRGE
jgi:antitoxin (DNA-binding transcriptional repressor) of toxin-antitoxin stability system